MWCRPSPYPSYFLSQIGSRPYFFLYFLYFLYFFGDQTSCSAISARPPGLLYFEIILLQSLLQSDLFFLGLVARPVWFIMCGLDILGTIPKSTASCQFIYFGYFHFCTFILVIGQVLPFGVLESNYLLE